MLTLTVKSLEQYSQHETMPQPLHSCCRTTNTIRGSVSTRLGALALAAALLWCQQSDAFVNGNRFRHNLRTDSTHSVSRRWRLYEGISSEEVRLRLEQQMERLSAKDHASRLLTPQDLTIAYEDDHIVVLDKPSGVLCSSNDAESPSLARTVFERLKQETKSDADIVSKMDQMVVHRLGMDTSGLVVMAKTMEAVREMNTAFRTRKVTRQYEALVCGHLSSKNDEGLISLPLMRDYEHPPFMRVSSENHQRHLLTLDPAIVGRKLLEAPKAATTHYQVLAREYLDGDDENEDLQVTRLVLTSVSGRTHQLNVHCAASGHPIVRDMVYGWQGLAAPYGGLDEASLPVDKASDQVQQTIARAARDRNMCVHAKLIRFRHPVTREEIECTSPAPF